MYLVGIDIGKNSHTFSIMNQNSGEIVHSPDSFKNNKTGFEYLINVVSHYANSSLLIGMEVTGHYHINLLKFLLMKQYTVALINPQTTNLERKSQGGITKNDPLDSITICDVLDSPARKKKYRITTFNSFELYEQRQLTRHHHNLKEQLNILCCRLQKCIDLVFPEYNSLFGSKYGIVYMNVLRTFQSAENIASADIESIKECFITNRKGRKISLTPEKLLKAAADSIGFSSAADEIQIKHLISQIDELNVEIDEVDKKIEEFSSHNNSPILSIPGISDFSGTSILAELGDIHNYSKASQIIKFAGVAPFHYESSQFNAQHTAITKHGSKYLRKTLYQVIIAVIRFNPVFKTFYNLKRLQGKSHRCAQGHCVRKLLRLIYHLESTNTQFDSTLLV